MMPYFSSALNRWCSFIRFPPLLPFNITAIPVLATAINGDYLTVWSGGKEALDAADRFTQPEKTAGSLIAGGISAG